MARDQQSLQIPLRSSNALHSDLNDSQEDLRSEKGSSRTSKAQKVLGTSDIPIQQDNFSRDDAGSGKRRTVRPSFMKPGGFVPFPTLNHPNQDEQQQQEQPQLRLRASSPLLVHGQSRDTAPKKSVHQSGSSSTLFSYFNSRDSTMDSNASPTDKQLKPEPSSVSLNSSKNSSKDSKRKLRPPRIDLSLLFPKPKPTNSHLLSPQRMTHSPSPLSAVGDFPKPENPEPRSPGRRFTASTQPSATTSTVTAGPPPPAVRRPDSHRSAPADRSSKMSTDTRYTDWLEPPLHRTVRTSEMDTALQNYSDQQQQQHQQQQHQQQQHQQQQHQQQKEQYRLHKLQQQKHQQQRQQQQQKEQQQKETERAQTDTASSVYSSRSHDHLHSSRSTAKTPQRVASNRSAGGWSKETYLSPKSQPRAARRHPSPSPDRWPAPPGVPESDTRTEVGSSMSKKSSKSALANSDLNTSSVLCLSSSEDENDDHDEVVDDRAGVAHLTRDSFTTYGEVEPEICTASAAQATRGPAVRRLDVRQANARGAGPRTMLMSPSLHRNPSMSSAGRSSYVGRRGTSRRSSGIPTITEPEILTSDHFPVPGGGRATLSQREIKEMNRRSRVISVTRQEQDLLEAMRLRKGKVTPSLFNESRFSQATNTSQQPPLPTHHSQVPDTDQGSIAPSRDSLYSTDMSFLRLSASVPSYTTVTTRTDQGAAHMDKDGLHSQGSGSDAEQKTLNSSASPRASLVYTESLPSPSTSGTSPLTPTLPIHRFSPLPTQHPPTQPLPAVPSQDQRRHSRRRTDSSEAIVLGEAPEESKETEEFPIWAYGWSHDQLAAVH